MVVELFLILVIILLIFYIAYMNKLHYYEIKGLYEKIGVNLQEKEENKITKRKIKNKFHEQMKKEQQGGE